MNTQIANRLESLVLDIGKGLINCEEEKQSELLYDDEYTKQYDSVQQLILSEESLAAILRHQLFKQCKDRELHQKIYQLIISKADDDQISLAILQIMRELRLNRNYMSSLANQISQTLKWTRKLKELEKKHPHPIKPRTQPPLNPPSDYEDTTTDDDDDESSSCSYPVADDEHFNPPQHETSSDSSSSSCVYSEPEQIPSKIKRNSPTKPPIKEGTYASINRQFNPHNNRKSNRNNCKNKKRNKRRKRRKKGAQNKKGNPENIAERNKNNENDSREYSHNFDQFSSSPDEESFDGENIGFDAKCVPKKEDTPVPPNKKRCEYCTFHNSLHVKKCTMCGNKFKDAGGKKEKERGKNKSNNHKKKGRKRRKPRHWTCNECGERNKSLTGRCKCGNEKGLEEHEWRCAICTTTNHCNQAKCKSCAEKRIFKNGRWQCLNCYKVNQQYSAKCDRCQKARPSAGVSQKSKKKKKKNPLPPPPQQELQQEPNVNMNTNMNMYSNYNQNPARYYYNNQHHNNYNNNRRQYQPKSRGYNNYAYNNNDHRNSNYYRNKRGRGQPHGQWAKKAEVGRYRRKPPVQVPLNNQEPYKTADNLSNHYMQQQHVQHAPPAAADGYHHYSHYNKNNHYVQQQNYNNYNHPPYNSHSNANRPRIPPMSRNKNNHQESRMSPPPNDAYEEDNGAYTFYGPQRDRDQRYDAHDSSTPPPEPSNRNQISLPIHSIF